MKYNPKLDSLRAACVLGVLLYHWELFGFGWAGVQCFFVLSGYLITGILLEYKQQFTVSDYFKIFYYRRSLRIFPLYFAYITGVAFTYMLFRVPEAFPQVGGYLYTYTLNIAKSLPGYRHSEAYTHLWSLAVEEQFYLLWPLVVLFLSLSQLKKLIWHSLWIVPLLRLLTGLAYSQIHTNPFFIGDGVYGMPTSHLDAFACGAAISMGIPAFVNRPARKLLFSSCLLVALGLIMLSFPENREMGGWSALGYQCHLYRSYQYVWGYSVLNITGAFLIATLAQKNRFDYLFLLKPVMFVGRISYGIYVLHWPIQLFFRQWFAHRSYTLASWVGFLLSTSVTILVAYLSFTWFESWFLRRKDHLALPAARVTDEPISLAQLQTKVASGQGFVAEEKRADDISV